jgi:hypothetical protein
MITVAYNKQHYAVWTVQEAQERNIQSKNYWEAKEGDYVESDNGYVVELLRTYTVEAKKTRVGGKWYERKKPIVTRYYLFPGCRFRVYQHNDITRPPKPFHWNQRYGTIQDLYDQTGRQLTPRKMYFALLVAQGFPPDVAIKMTHNDKTVHRQRTRLMEYMTCQQTLHYLSKTMTIMGTLKDELIKRGITKETLADRIVTMIDDHKEPVVLRKWALDMVSRAFDNEVNETVTTQQYLPIGINTEDIRAKLMLKASEINKAVEQ